MKQILILAAIVLLASSASLIELNTETKSIRDPDPNEGVLQCIARVSPLIDSPNLFCGEMVTKNAACYSSYFSLQLCLVNNECESTLEAPTVYKL
jgi:hypothetical protein